MKIKGYVYSAKTKSEAGHVDSSADKRLITAISKRPTPSYIRTHRWQNSMCSRTLLGHYTTRGPKRWCGCIWWTGFVDL